MCGHTWQGRTPAAAGWIVGSNEHREADLAPAATAQCNSFLCASHRLTGHGSLACLLLAQHCEHVVVNDSELVDGGRGGYSVGRGVWGMGSIACGAREHHSSQQKQCGVASNGRPCDDAWIGARSSLRVYGRENGIAGHNAVGICIPLAGGPMSAAWHAAMHAAASSAPPRGGAHHRRPAAVCGAKNGDWQVFHQAVPDGGREVRCAGTCVRLCGAAPPHVAGALHLPLPCTHQRHASKRPNATSAGPHWRLCAGAQT